MNLLRNRLRIFKRDVLTLFFAVRRGETPVASKALAVFTILYIISPVDIIPDVIPFFGIVDDVVITPFLITTAVKFLPAGIREASTLEARRHSRKLTIILVIVSIAVIALMALFVILGWKLLEWLF